MVYNLEDILFQWENYGVFTVILPFLLVFAIVFGILKSTRFMGDNNGVYVIVSVAIGLISLRYTYFVSDFFSAIFPRLGIGLAVIISALILVGMFISKDESRYWGYGLATIGFIIFVVIVYQSFDQLGWYVGGYSNDTVGLIILAVLLIGVIIAVASAGSSGSRSADDRAKRGSAVFLPEYYDKHH